jgi:hypothetical protein
MILLAMIRRAVKTTNYDYSVYPDTAYFKNYSDALVSAPVMAAVVASNATQWNGLNVLQPL